MKIAESRTFYLIILLILFLGGSNLSAQSERREVSQISISSFGELGEFRYTFSKAYLKEHKMALGHSDSAYIKITYNDWNQIIAEINKVYLDSIQFYKPPTNYSQIDGDWFSYINIWKENKHYQTPYYDSSNPHQKLIKLDSILYAISRKYSEINWDELYEKAKEETQEIYQEPVYQFVEKMPEYVRGNDSLNYYIQNELRKYGIEEGKAFVRFTIQKSGQMKDIELLKASDESIGKAALKIITDLPEWIPGRQDDKTVNVQMILPIELNIKYP